MNLKLTTTTRCRCLIIFSLYRLGSLFCFGFMSVYEKSKLLKHISFVLINHGVSRGRTGHLFILTAGENVIAMFLTGEAQEVIHYTIIVLYKQYNLMLVGRRIKRS